MARNVTVYFADGSRHQYQGVPDDASPEQVAARAAREFQGKQIRHIERAPAPEPERTVGGYAKEALKGLVPGLVGLGETAITGAAALLPEEAEQAVRRPVEEFAAGVRETFAPAPGYEDTAVRKISEAVGSTLPFLPLGALGLAGRAAAAGLGVSVGAGEARQRAEEAGATEGERGVATALGTIPGALESLPPIRILRRFGFGDEAIKEVAGVAPALGRIARAGGEEALQEASSQVLQNLIAKGVYAPDEAVFGGVGEAATLGGGAGAVVSAIAELALGRRLRGPEGEPTTEKEKTEEEEAITGEALAPKPGREARPSPVKAKTIEELTGLIPAAPKAEEEKIEAPAREPMAFERTKEPTPEALQEAAAFVEKFPAGSKGFDIFKARSIAKKLGYEGIPSKGVGRVDLEPLIRSAVAPRETVTPAEDVVVGQNVAGEQLYERQDGSRYRMRFDRADRPAGYPDFGGDLAPVEMAEEITVPEMAQVAPVETVTPVPAVEIAAPKPTKLTDVPEMAQVDVLSGKEIRPPTDDIYEVAEANFNYPRIIGNQTVPIEQLEGGVTAQAGERKRVDELANQIASDEGYFSRIIVDQNNSVIEGQHRLEALRKLGAKKVPVFKIEDMGDTFPVMKMEAAILKAQPMREEQASQIVKRALNAVAETGSVQEAAKLKIPGFQKGYVAALNAIEPVTPTVEVPSGPPRESIVGPVVEPSGRGVELPVPRFEPAGPEVAAPPPARLERPSSAAPRVDVGEKAPAPALKPIKGVSGAEAFSESEIKNYRVPEFKGKDRLVEMPIDDFLSLAERGYLESKQKNTDKLFKEGTKFNTLPSLHVYTTKEGTLQVEGHEGRHRARTLKNAGYETIPVVLKSNIRWSEQNDPSTFDYEANWPTALVSQDKKKTVPMPITREQAYLPYDTKDVLPEAPALEIQKIQEKYTASVNQYNDYADQYKVADEAQRAKLRPMMDKLTLEQRQLQSQVQKINQQQFRTERQAESKAKFEPMPVGTRIGMIGLESSEDSYWEKVGENKWQRTLGGKTDDVFKTSAEIDDGRMLPPAPTPTRLFESIESLNRPLPPVTEQLARDRAPSLRVELKKAKKEYDAGAMTGDEFAETASNLLLQTQKERVVRPRVRGADYIRERLLNAKRTGALSSEAADLAEWFVRQNPLLVEDLGVSIRQQPDAMEGTAGFYNPVSRIATVFTSAGDDRTATHEILHHTERLMPTNIRAGILKAYVKQLTRAIKSAKSPNEKNALKALLDHHLTDLKPADYDSVIADMKSGKLSTDYYQYINPSEFWAVNGSRIVQGRFDMPPGLVSQIRKWLREFLEKAKDVFGLKSDAAVIRALDSLAKADGKYQTDKMLAEAPAYQAVEPTKAAKPKKAKPEKPKKSISQLRREATDRMVEPGIVRKVVNGLVNPQTSYETIVKNFQNVSRKVKKIQQDLNTAGRLVYVGDDKNNIDDQISAAANRGSYIVATEVEPVAKRLRESIAAYANATKTTIKEGLEKLDGYFIALHEAERRETKYLRNVPLNNVTKINILPGEPEMTPADARDALEKRRSLAQNKAQAEAIQDVIRYLVANYADPRGYSPVKAKLEKAGKPTPEEMTTDYYDDIYNVIGPEYTQEDLEATREEYENLDQETRALVDQVRDDLAAVHELNKNLNRRANYWTDKVDRVVESYGWKNYVPFKGSAKADKSFDTDTEYLSGELSETPESFEGRRSNFDSPLLQSIAESYFAASRAGRGTDVTQTIKNLVKLGVIKTKTKKPKVFTFEERNSPDFDYNEVRGRDKILHYNEDGSVEVLSVENPEILEAIKTPYREMNWAVKAGNALTSGLGQLHTRFNVAFPPMDFIRNSLTNAGLISAREGGKQAREYLTAVAANVARNGLWKSGKLSKLLAENRVEELESLAKKSPFYRDTLEMMKYGGRTMYRLSFNITDTMEDLKKQVGPKKIIKDPSLFMRLVDAYNDAFELTSRVGAYTIRKQQNIAEAKKQGLNVNDRKVMEDINKEAAAFALSLMDFRKIGKYGREMGAWFMFIRPAATGAVDAIDALRPGFATPQKAFDRLEPEVQELFETQGLAQEIERIKGNKRPDKKKIAELEQEIARRERAFDEFETRQLTRAKNARNTAMFTVAAGAALYGMAAAVAGDDDEGRNRVTTDDMSRWTRYLRLPVIGDKGFFQIPWGFGVSALMSAGAQTAALANGSSSFKDYAGNMVEIGMDSFLPIPASRINPFENFGAWLIDSATPSAARPLVEFVLNVDAMGNPIYNSRAGKYADAFSGSTRPSEMHRKITETIFNATNGEVSISPDTVAFFLNNYADAPNHIAENSWNLVLTAQGDKAFDAKKDTFFLRSFIGRNSNYDARKFAEAEKEIKKLSQQLKTFEDLGTPDQILRFYRKNPNADILVDTYNKGVNGELKRLQSERKQIMLDRTLTPKQRDQYVEDIRLQENYIKKLLVEDFEAYKGN